MAAADLAFGTDGVRDRVGEGYLEASQVERLSASIAGPRELSRAQLGRLQGSPEHLRERFDASPLEVCPREREALLGQARPTQARARWLDGLDDRRRVGGQTQRAVLQERAPHPALGAANELAAAGRHLPASGTGEAGVAQAGIFG